MDGTLRGEIHFKIKDESKDSAFQQWLIGYGFESEFEIAYLCGSLAMVLVEKAPQGAAKAAKAHARGAWERLDLFRQQIQAPLRQAPKRLGDPRPQLRLGRLDALTTMGTVPLWSTSRHIGQFFFFIRSIEDIGICPYLSLGQRLRFLAVKEASNELMTSRSEDGLGTSLLLELPLVIDFLGFLWLPVLRGPTVTQPPSDACDSKVALIDSSITEGNSRIDQFFLPGYKTRSSHGAPDNLWWDHGLSWRGESARFPRIGADQGRADP
ncbi:hypothetical protein Taro_023253 [Colocasia esculenta]|uniref:Uncharacterized protein n=1 Tax=Colocasia esculenta TaxID=4460 RepID=A0A843V7T8_COLES|nr:hypothetical protein [Colocasia esculenta]